MIKNLRLVNHLIRISRKEFSVSEDSHTPSKGSTDIQPDSKEHLAEKFSKAYDPPRFIKANDANFLERLKKIEEGYKAEREPKDWKSYLRNLELPLLFIFGSLFTYYLWSTCPYTVVFKHFTLSEYTLRKYYLHTIATASLSFKTQGQILTYLPPMIYSCLILAKKLRGRHFAILFLLNSVFTSILTLLYEKYDQGFNNKMILPKVNGSSTALALMSCLFSLSPGHCLFGVRFLPFAFFPLAFFFYELNEYREAYVKEISRPAHILSIFNGIVVGLLFRRYGTLMNLR